MRFKPILCCLLALAAHPILGRDLPKLEVSAPSAIIISAESGQVLWSKDADTPRFPASTTKIMTALLLIERCRPDEIITAPKGIKDVKESSMHLEEGEQVTAHDMLYGLLLRSANDGCVAVADHISGSVGAFAALMNQRARELGCTHTHFDNPNGLNDPVHTISAHDLAIIAREAMRHPEFRDVVKLTKHHIKRSINQKDTWMVSRNKWLRKDPTADGIKTGWTIPAGHCYVGSATRRGFRLITVVMHSEHWEADHKKMLHWAYTLFDPHPLSGPQSPMTATATTIDGKSLPVTMEHPRYYLAPSGSSPASYRLELAPGINSGPVANKITAKVARGQTIGVFVFTAEGGEFQGEAIADADYTPPTRRTVSKSALSLPTLLIGGVLAGSAFAMRKKAQRMYGGRLGTR
ncbi:MAG TPA: D-alanyl-D-alanine carboxypeptidase family protein [Fimbriimonadaceae bacterium]|nr:D-alanyl-D-alanine carboxypeptidase family protein [Fimbriimonadaceae bacterium]